MVLQPNCKMRPRLGREFPITRLGLAEKSSRTGYQNNPPGVLSLGSLPAQLKIQLVREACIQWPCEYQPHFSRGILNAYGIGKRPCDVPGSWTYSSKHLLITNKIYSNELSTENLCPQRLHPHRLTHLLSKGVNFHATQEMKRAQY